MSIVYKLRWGRRATRTWGWGSRWSTKRHSRRESWKKGCLIRGIYERWGASLLPKSSSSCSPSSSSQFIDYTHVPDSTRILATQLPVVNPYKVFHKSSFSPTRSIKKILQSTPAPVTSQDAIQSSSIDHYLIPSFAQEHYLDLHISQDLIKEWLKQRIHTPPLWSY